MIVWRHFPHKSVAWRSSDWLYSVGETYTVEGVKYRACFHAHAQAAHPLGEKRDTAEEAKRDCEIEAERIARAAA